MLTAFVTWGVSTAVERYHSQYMYSILHACIAKLAQDSRCAEEKGSVPLQHMWEKRVVNLTSHQAD